MDYRQENGCDSAALLDVITGSRAHPNPDILHFIGHGCVLVYDSFLGRPREAPLFLSRVGIDNMPRAESFDCESIPNVLRSAIINHGRPRVIVLQTCESARFGKYLVEKIPNLIVICWITKVLDEACHVFTYLFYKSLFSEIRKSGGSCVAQDVLNAFFNARNSITSSVCLFLLLAAPSIARSALTPHPLPPLPAQYMLYNPLAPESCCTAKPAMGIPVFLAGRNVFAGDQLFARAQSVASSSLRGLPAGGLDPSSVSTSSFSSSSGPNLPHDFALHSASNPDVQRNKFRGGALGEPLSAEEAVAATLLECTDFKRSEPPRPFEGRPDSLVNSYLTRYQSVGERYEDIVLQITQPARADVGVQVFICVDSPSFDYQRSRFHSFEPPTTKEFFMGVCADLRDHLCGTPADAEVVPPVPSSPNHAAIFAPVNAYEERPISGLFVEPAASLFRGGGGGATSLAAAPRGAYEDAVPRKLVNPNVGFRESRVNISTGGLVRADVKFDANAARGASLLSSASPFATRPARFYDICETVEGFSIFDPHHCDWKIFEEVQLSEQCLAESRKLRGEWKARYLLAQKKFTVLLAYLHERLRMPSADLDERFQTDDLDRLQWALAEAVADVAHACVQSKTDAVPAVSVTPELKHPLLDAAMDMIIHLAGNMIVCNRCYSKNDCCLPECHACQFCLTSSNAAVANSMGLENASLFERAVMERENADSLQSDPLAA